MHEKSYLLTVNAGSSSIKFAVFDSGGSLERILSGKIDRIGLSDPVLEFQKESNDKESQPIKAQNQEEAASVLFDWIEKHVGFEKILAIGHRVVHGGLKYTRATKVTDAMVDELSKLTALDPEHLSVEIKLIKAFSKRLPNLLQVACFDTAFHKDMPKVARMIPIPRNYFDQGVMRYGFHGLSYTYLIEELCRLSGNLPKRVILAHLGNGASLAAAYEGKSMDTSMGFTPTSGIPMSSRSGDLDPGIIKYFANVESFEVEKFHEMINFKSGLLGISETSSDMHDLLQIESKDPRASEAIDLFCYQVKKWIGAYAAVLGGVDALVFSGGIGENSPDIRARICKGLEFLGIEIEEKKNLSNEGLISLDKAPVSVRVIKTNEELVIAQAALDILSSK